MHPHTSDPEPIRSRKLSILVANIYPTKSYVFLLFRDFLKGKIVRGRLAPFETGQSF